MLDWHSTNPLASLTGSVTPNSCGKWCVVNQAPALRVHSSSPRLLNLERIYGAWAEHFEKCSTCNATTCSLTEDWFDPDMERLCQQGRTLMANWKAGAMSTPFNAADLYA